MKDNNDNINKAKNNISESANTTSDNPSPKRTHPRYIIRTKLAAYNTDYDYVDGCNLEETEKVMRQALVDNELEDYQKRDILFKYGRRRVDILHYPMDYTEELRDKTIEMNDHLSQKCILAGKIMMELIRMARQRGLESDKLSICMDVLVSKEQPWEADDLERTMVMDVMGNNLVVKSYYNNDNPEEYIVRNKILGLHDDDDNWNEALPEQWSKGLQLTFPFDRIRDGIPISWELMTQIRNFDIEIDETYNL